MNKTYILSEYLKPSFASEGSKSHWFGYYNYSPISADGTKLLAQEVDFDGRDILPEDTADVGWYDLKDGKWHKVATTRAINWQQGAMLQWLGPDFNTRIVFNDVDGEHFCSRIYNVATGEMKTIPFPVYGVSPDGKFSITLQFERCAWCRAYHYESIHNPKWNVPVPEEDGIFRVNLETGEVKRIIAIGDIVALLKSGESDGTESHWVEHVMLNPSGTRFAFYHRYGHGYEFNTIAYTANVDGSGLERIPCEARTWFSHLGWRNDDEFVIYTYKNSRIQKGYVKTRQSKKLNLKSIVISCLRQILHLLIPAKVRAGMLTNSFYVFTDVKNKKIVFDTRNNPMSQHGDGHPSFTKDGRYMLTDSYADKDGYRNLLLFDCESKKHLVLGRFHSPFNNCGYRADLHPRFSRDEKSVIIDSAHTGQHQIHVFALDWDAIRGMA